MRGSDANGMDVFRAFRDAHVAGDSIYANMLLLGYAWLVIGLLLFGAALLFPRLPLTVALHGITVGALGTLTLAVMARTRLLYRLRDANARPWIHPAAVLLTLAALGRLALALAPLRAGA